MRRMSKSIVPPPPPLQKKPRTMRTELDRLLMDEGTVNMLCDTTAATGESKPTKPKDQSNSANKKAKLEALHLKRLQVLSTVKNRSGDSVKKLREKKKPETTMGRRRSEEGYANGVPEKGPPGPSWFKGRRASLLAGLKGDRNGTAEDVGAGKKAELIEGPPVQKRILSFLTKDGLGHVTITFQANGRCTIDLKTLKDLTNTLQKLGSDPNIKVILVSSSGNSKFCNGVDLRELIGGGSERKKVAEEFAEAINAYLSTLSKLRKLTIISLHSSVSNLFVMSLPLFDLVYASDKCTFRCNYLSLNQVPEGGSLLQESLGRTAFNNLIYGRRILTATEAKECGLVTEVLWPARYQEEVVLRVRNFLRYKQWSSLPLTKSSLPRLKCLSEPGLAESKRNLVSSWLSEDFQIAATRFVNSRLFPC